MNLDFISSATAKELQQFKSVCNQLLSRTFVVRTLYRPGRERLNNPDYTFGMSADRQVSRSSSQPCTQEHDYLDEIDAH